MHDILLLLFDFYGARLVRVWGRKINKFAKILAMKMLIENVILKSEMRWSWDGDRT